MAWWLEHLMQYQVRVSLNSPLFGLERVLPQSVLNGMAKNTLGREQK